jgi:hypothetical protein
MIAESRRFGGFWLEDGSPVVLLAPGKSVGSMSSNASGAVSGEPGAVFASWRQPIC